MLKDLVRFPDVVEDISGNYQVHHLAQYAFSLAGDFHKFYEKHHVIQENDSELQSARLLLVGGSTYCSKDLFGAYESFDPG